MKNPEHVPGILTEEIEVLVVLQSFLNALLAIR